MLQRTIGKDGTFCIKLFRYLCHVECGFNPGFYRGRQVRNEILYKVW